MKNEKSEALIGIILIVFLTVFGYFLFSWIVSVFWTLDKTVQASMIAAVVAVFSIIFTFWKERSRSINEAHRGQKIETYSIFFDFLFEFLNNAKQEKLPTDFANDEAFQQSWMDMSKKMLFYGSPKVLTAFNDLKTSSDETQDTIKILRRVGRILLAIREDIGLSNSGLNEINIHQIYLSENVASLSDGK